MSAVMAVTTVKVSPSGRYAWQIFARSSHAAGGDEAAIVVICESMETFASVYAALLSGQRVLQAAWAAHAD
ncbi:hypothetical protein [Xenophilus sp. Marseille-Q4582]|uniref:hypothetical protein n=1 Tax=Xenophilus sp. Marseille-Q4582 TaxID=2866600 RepID=UPI001CE3EDCE|nr:hypothetical protein [Xenophilus sp. Marseille-Q4582]